MRTYCAAGTSSTGPDFGSFITNDLEHWGTSRYRNSTVIQDCGILCQACVTARGTAVSCLWHFSGLIAETQRISPWNRAVDCVGELVHACSSEEISQAFDNGANR